MELLRELLVGVGLYTESLSNGEDLEEERKFATVSLTDFCRDQSLVVLDHVE